MSDSDSDSGHEETWLDDVAHVDWFLMKSGKSRGKGGGVRSTSSFMLLMKIRHVFKNVS